MTQNTGGLKRAFALAALGVLAAGPVLGEDAKSQRAPTVQALIDCKKIEDSAQRLACYDTSVSKLQEAEASGDLVTADREQRRAARRLAFGFNLPSMSFLDRGDKPEEVKKVTLKVASAGHNKEGAWVIRMEDGAVWRQVDEEVLSRPPHTGSTAVVEKGVLGAYFMRIDGGFNMHVRRDN
jgi:hypothetical protein